MSATIECSTSECKKRFLQVKKMSFFELEKYTDICCSCGDWILKSNEVANKTFHAVSNRYAEEYMKKIASGGN